jgi:hypothetical protein
VPRPIIDKLNAAINKAIASQTFKDRFAMIGDEPAGGTHPPCGGGLGRGWCVWQCWCTNLRPPSPTPPHKGEGSTPSVRHHFAPTPGAREALIVTDKTNGRRAR